MQSHKFNKVVVFDLDETLGYFIELGIFWDSLQTFITTNNLILEENNTTSNITQYRFNQVLDLYPEFIRPDILIILEYIKIKDLRLFFYRIKILIVLLLMWYKFFLLLNIESFLK
jgi:hypothetical protein